jgi:PAS domain S-box-containing protein
MTDKISTDKPSYQDLEHQVAALTRRLADLERENLELHDSEDKFRTLVADAEAVLYRVDGQGVVLEVSPTITSVLGYAPGEMQGHNFIDFIYKPDVPFIIEAFGTVASGELKPDEYRLVTKNGQPIWVRTFSRPVFQDGIFQGLRGVLVDVDDRRRYFEEINEQKRRLEALVNYSNLAIVVLDEQRRIISCNRFFEKLFQYTEAEIRGGVLDELISKAPERAEAESHTEKVMGGQTVHTSGVRWKKDGTRLHVDIIGVPMIIDEDVVGAYGIYKDVSELVHAQEAIGEKEILYRTLFETAQDAILMMKDELYIDCNPAALEIFAGDKSRIVGRTPFNLSPPKQPDRQKSRDKALYLINQACQGRPQSFEWRHRRCDGSEFDAEVRLNSLELSGELFLQAMVRDITARKMSEKALKESEARYRTILEATGDGYYETDLSGNFIFCNEAFSRILGYSRQEMMGMNYEQSTAPGDAERARRDFGRVYDTEKSVSGLQWPILTQNGQIRYLDVSVSLMRDEQGRKVGFRGLVRDITDRRQTEEALRCSQQRYQELFDSIGDLIMTHDLEGRLLEVNPAVAASFGYSREELIGRLISDFMVSRYKVEFDEGYLKPMLEHGRREGVFIVLDKNGQEHYIEYRNTLVEQAGQEPYCTGVSRDVTERILAQRELRQLEEQLTQSQKMEAVGTLSSGISHDFNNILQAISGYIQLLLTNNSQDETSWRYLMEVERAVERASELVKGLLTFSRKVKTARKPVNVNEVVKRAVKLLERTIPRMIAIEVDLAPDLATIVGDPSQLEQVLMNLGANAKDAMAEGGRLAIETRNVTLDQEYCRAMVDVSPGEYVLLSVRDSGHGMDEETSRHVFEPFFTTKDVGKGTGLGLSTVYGIVRNHHGHVRCESAPGRGTAFHVHFPAANGDIGEDTASEEPRESTAFGSETILLVDDEPSILEVAEEVLQAHGYNTISAANGDEALRIFAEKCDGIDLVIMDLGMPGMGGEVCFREMRKIRSGTRAIIASGYTGDLEVQDLLDSGARAFIGKPYRLKDLLDTVRAVLDG